MFEFDLDVEVNVDVVEALSIFDPDDDRIDHPFNRRGLRER